MRKRFGNQHILDFVENDLHDSRLSGGLKAERLFQHWRWDLPSDALFGLLTGFGTVPLCGSRNARYLCRCLETARSRPCSWDSSYLALRQCRTLRWRSPSAYAVGILWSLQRMKFYTPRRRRSLLTGRRTKGIRPCFSTSDQVLRYSPWFFKVFQNIRLTFYCGDVMIIVTGPYTCGAVMNHRAVVYLYAQAS